MIVTTGPGRRRPLRKIFWFAAATSGYNQGLPAPQSRPVCVVVTDLHRPDSLAYLSAGSRRSLGIAILLRPADSNDCECLCTKRSGRWSRTSLGEKLDSHVRWRCLAWGCCNYLGGTARLGPECGRNGFFRPLEQPRHCLLTAHCSTSLHWIHRTQERDYTYSRFPFFERWHLTQNSARWSM